MLNHAVIYAAHQRARWMRPDAGRYSRPDAAKSFTRDTDAADVGSALADHCIALDGLRCHLNQIKSDLAWRRLLRAVARKYNADQPRVPAGEAGGGQWTSGGSGSGRPRIRIFRSNPEDEGAGDGGMLDEIVVDGSEVESALNSEARNDDASGPGDDVTWDDRTDWPNDPTQDDERPTRINDTRIVNDADPEPVLPGEQYAQTRRGGRGSSINLTPREAVQLDIARSRAEESIARVREIDPNWKPAPSAYQTVDGMIRAYEADAVAAQARASELAAQRLMPGPFAGESIPARNSGRSRTVDEQRELNRIGSETGCHSCGTTNSGLPSGNFIGDHQPPSALNSTGRAQRLFPHCASCSAQQGPAVQRLSRKR